MHPPRKKHCFPKIDDTMAASDEDNVHPFKIYLDDFAPCTPADAERPPGSLGDAAHGFGCVENRTNAFKLTCNN